MSRKRPEPCGCVSDDRQWLVMCEPCRLEWHTRHVQAAADRAGLSTAAPNEYAWLDAPQPDGA